MLTRYLNSVKYQVEKHYYCEKCLFYVEDPSAEACPACSLVFTANSGKLFYVTVPIKKQLSVILNSRETMAYIENCLLRLSDDNSLQDIIDGRVHRQLVSNFQGDHNSVLISFLWNTDGVSVFRST